MSFIKDDEFFLLMDVESHLDGELGRNWHDLPEIRTPGVFSEDDLKQLRDVGIQTTIPFYMRWNEVETSEGVWNWDVYDAYKAKCDRVGLKVLFQTASHYPTWFPDDWYVKTVSGVEKAALSPWSDEAMARNLDFSQRLIDRYAGENCMIHSVQLRCGETVLLNEAAFYDDHALASYRKYAGSSEIPVQGEPFTEGWLRASYIKMIVDQQRVMAAQPQREIWMMLHPAIAQFGYYGNGNNWIYEIMYCLSMALSPVKFNHIYYTWIQWGALWPAMNQLRDIFHEDVYGGAEYTEGLPITAPNAIAQGLRGHILAPCYPGVHDKLEPYMLENIKEAQRMWMGSRG